MGIITKKEVEVEVEVKYFVQMLKDNADVLKIHQYQDMMAVLVVLTFLLVVFVYYFFLMLLSNDIEIQD